MEAGLAALSSSEQQLRRQLEERTLECRVREQIHRALVRGADVGQAALTLVEELAPNVISRVLFSPEGKPLGWISPRAERLANAELLGLGEPLARRCWERQAVCSGEAPSGLLEGETGAVALPVPGAGVLYVSRPAAFSEHELHWLMVLAGQLGPALAFARRTQELEQESERSRRQEKALGQWVEGLSRLLEAAGRMASSLESGLSLLVSHLEEVLGALFPDYEHCIAVFLEGRWEVARFTSEPSGLQAVLERLEPLPGVWEGRLSTVVPLRAEDRVLGCLVVGSRFALSAVERDLLAAVGYQASAAMSGALLHEELRVAYQELQSSRAQLVQSSKLAAVGELAAGVAHELNTPLGTILLSLEAAQMAVGSGNVPAVEKRLGRARNELLRAREIVAKLLYYSRDAASAGRVRVSLEKVVQDTLELIGHQLSGMTVKTVFEPTGPFLCNANEIQQVLMNLLLNARDAMGSKGSVRIRVFPEGVEVSDDGPGIAPDVLEKIFDPFFTTKPVGKGTGLGLSVSKQIVESHGGTLTVRSAPGAGSTFTVRLPAG